MSEFTVEDALRAADEQHPDTDWAAVLEILAAEVRRLRIVLGDTTEHVIEFTDDGWTIMHPIACRPDLFACPVNRAAGDRLTAPIATVNGRYTCALDESGRFIVGRRVQ